MKKYHFVYLVAIAILTVAGVITFVVFDKFQSNIKPARISDLPKVANFEECSKAGYPILESYPRKCRAVNGEIFTENKDSSNYNTTPTLAEKDQLIRVVHPRPNQIVKNPLEIAGEARGNWFFEASFPISIVDGNGKEIVKGIAKADGDWMTEKFVPFSAILSFKKPETESGELVLTKDNPSGLVENEGELRIPIFFE